MKEFVEKLIERLDKVSDLIRPVGWSRKIEVVETKGVIEIINELAEEYKSRVMIDNEYCWQKCGAVEHCKECNRLGNGTTDYFENYDSLTEEYNNGWIPCSERLPEEDGKYIVTVKNLTGRWIMKNNVFVCNYWDDDFHFQGWDDNEVIAWQPLPQPCKEGSE